MKKSLTETTEIRREKSGQWHECSLLPPFQVIHGKVIVFLFRTLDLPFPGTIEPQTKPISF